MRVLGTRPSTGDFVRLRGRQWLVESDSQLPNGLTTIALACIEDDAQGEKCEVVWEAELDKSIETDDLWSLLGRDGADSLNAFAAYIRTIKWNTATIADRRLLQAPFRAGIRLDPYQLAPLSKALKLPRVNLLIADDVGLGKTIEAGLIMREMLLRRRIDYVVVTAPASMTYQWKDELANKFGIGATIVDREYLEQVRWSRGFLANPWSTGSFFIVSHRLIVDETYTADLRNLLGNARAKSLLVLDEAHHAAPASGERYAIDSQFTTAIRDLAARFENRLFLTATPHNGHSNSFSALLEILDPQRFTRGVAVRKQDLNPIMVRRLKSDLRALGEKFPHRKVEPIRIEDLSPDTAELHLARLLDEYGELRNKRIARLPPKTRAEAHLVFSGLQQRLLSSIAAFCKTLEVHRKSLEKQKHDHSMVVLELARAFALPPEAPEDEAEAEETELRLIEVDESEAAEAATIIGAAEATAAELEAELAKVDEMLAFARPNRHKADERVKRLGVWIRENLIEAGGWNNRRLILFTEYEDTRKWLHERLLEELHDVVPAERISFFSGVTRVDRREQIKHAFNTDPAQEPLRILICTDAAREGINLQSYCSDLIHIDLPWNPSRLEQRNGRIDRKLQPAPEVSCRYFVYCQRETDAVLDALVRKTERIRRELGAVGKVIEDKITARLSNAGISRSEAAQMASEFNRDDDGLISTIEAELDDEASRRIARLKVENDSLYKLLDDSKRRVGIAPGDLQQVYNAALARMGVKNQEEPVFRIGQTEVFTLDPADPVFAQDPTWADVFDELRSRPPKPGEKRTEWRQNVPPRGISFQSAILPDGRDAAGVAQLHVEHRLMKRLLSRFISQGFKSGLQRACVLASPGTQPRVILLGRLSLFGPGAIRLHEEIIPVAAIWREADAGRSTLKPLAEKGESMHLTLDDLEKAIESCRDAPEGVVKRLIAGAKTDAAALRPEFERRAGERADVVLGDLERNGADEAAALRKILEDQRSRIAKQANDPKLNQLILGFDDKELRQLEGDRRHWRARLQQLELEIIDEPERVKESYRVKARRLEPVGIVYLWPTAA